MNFLSRPTSNVVAPRPQAWVQAAVQCLAAVLLLQSIAAAEEQKAVYFTTDVLPLLQKNCLACHNESEYEGDLILESIEQLMNGGDSGPAVIAGKAEESILYQLATHNEEPVMPPLDNDVGAKRLTDDELAILKQWINEGALDDPESTSDVETVEWRAIPDKHASVLALEVSPNGRWLVSGRGNRLLVYSILQQRLEQQLVDPSLPETHTDSAHLDAVQSIAWNADATLLASGGYRVVKIWQRQPGKAAEAPSELQVAATTPDGKYRLEIHSEDNQSVAKLIQVDGTQEVKVLPASLANQDNLATITFHHGLRTQKRDVLKSDVESAKKRKADAEKDVEKADEEIKKATEEVAKQQAALSTSESSLQELTQKVENGEKQLEELAAKLEQLGKDLSNAEESTSEEKQALEKQQTDSIATQKQAQEQLNNDKKQLEKTQQELQKKQQAFAEAEQAAERSKKAKQRLQEIVVTRQTEIEQANETLAQHQTVVDTSTKALERAQQATAAPWVHVTVADDGSEFRLHNNAGTIVSVTPDSGQLIAMRSSQVSDTWQLVQTLGNANGESPFADRVTSLAFRHDGKVLAIGGGEPSRSGEVQLWSTETWQPLGVVEDIHSDVVYDLQFAPLGNQLASCASDRMVKLIDSDTATHLRTFEGHTGHVLGVSWRADGRTLATAGADQVVKIWDAQEGGQKKTISGFKGEVTAVRYLGLDNRLVFGTGRGDIHSRDSEGNGKPGFGKLTDYVHRISCSQDGSVIAGAGTDRMIRVWNADGKQLAEFP